MFPNLSNTVINPFPYLLQNESSTLNLLNMGTLIKLYGHVHIMKSILYQYLYVNFFHQLYHMQTFETLESFSNYEKTKNVLHLQGIHFLPHYRNY